MANSGLRSIGAVGLGAARSRRLVGGFGLRLPAAAAGGGGGSTPEADFAAVARVAYDLDAQGETDGTALTTIVDQSPNGNNATQATASLKPVAQTRGTTKVARFDGVNDTIQSGAFTSLAVPYTVVALTHLTSVDATNRALFDGSGSSGRCQLYVTAGNTLQTFVTTGSGSFVRNPTGGAWHLYTIVFRSSGGHKLWDKQGGTFTAMVDGSHSITKFTLGSRWDGAANFLKGDHAYVGLYPGDLHTDDLTLLNDLRSSLGGRVGLTVTDIT